MGKEKKVKVGIIGLGKMGILHTALVNMIPRAELVALSDINKQLSKYVKESGLKVPFFSDSNHMLNEVELNAVYICIPPFANLSIVRQCVEYNLDMFVEKPLAESFESAKKMVEFVSKKEIIHSIGYLFAHIPLFRKAKNLLEKKIIGNIFRFRSSIYISEVFTRKKGWYYDKTKSGGGAVINIASHLLYLLYWYFGSVKSVFSLTKKVYSEVEDTASAFLEFTNGIIGTLDVSWSVPGYRLSYIEIIIEGKNGILELTNDYIKLYLFKPVKGFNKEWNTIHKIDLPGSSQFELGGEGCYEEDLNFIECCVERKAPDVTWIDGLEIQKIIEAIYRSADSKKIVQIGEID